MYFCRMITIGEMQISGMLTMAMLSAMLALCVPMRSIHRNSFAMARKMMAAGTGLIALQFLLQYKLGFRQMGVTQAVLLNLLLFTPASLLCSMAILYVQRQGSVSLKEWFVGGVACCLTILILLITVLTDGVPITQESSALRMAEYVGAVLYVLMQSYIFVKQYKAYKHLELAIDEYFDRERRDLFGWMGWSMRTMAVLAFFVPVVIFLESTPLVMFSIVYFVCISYSTISLYRYGVSEDAVRVEEAEDKPDTNYKYAVKESRMANSQQPDQGDSQVEKAVERWKENRKYKEHNLTLGVVARQMGMPRKQLQEWLRQSEYKNLAGLVTLLRIEEAKGVLKEHSDWSVESVADYCGFSSREYFHRAFRHLTGMTPAKYQQIAYETKT